MSRLAHLSEYAQQVVQVGVNMQDLHHFDTDEEFEVNLPHPDIHGALTEGDFDELREMIDDQARPEGLSLAHLSAVQSTVIFRVNRQVYAH